MLYQNGTGKIRKKGRIPMVGFGILLFSILWVLWNYWTLRLIDTSLGSIVLRDAQGTILTQKGRAGGYQKAYNRTLDSTLIQSIIEIEDRRFFEHDGVDIIGKIGALQENIGAGKIVRGGSTITEQYIKNTYYRGVARTYGQKLREFSNAVFIEITTGKEDILRDYLNSLYFGNGIYGLQTWIDTSYGGRDIHTLSENEILNTLDKIQKPNRGMEDISYKTHIAERLGFSGTITSPKEKPQSYYKDDFPLLTERILEEQSKYCHGEENILIQFLHTDYDRTKICRSDIDLQLSIQLEDMKYAASLVRGILGPLEKENIKNAAIYAIDPKNNKVRVYVANRENESLATKNIDMIQEKRSVGSILKPFIYLQALQDGADPEDLILDSMRVYPTGENDTYFIPQNYIPRAYGPVRLREALGNSLNSSSVRLTETLGLGKVYESLEGIGARLDHEVGYYGYGLALGNIELTLENVTHMYTSLIDVREKDIYLISDILKDPNNRAKTFGISSILNSSIPIPVKTGTSTDFRDNWTVSYHPNIIIGVWVGNSDGSPMEDVSGVSGAGPIWKKLAEYFIQKGVIESWSPPVPSGIHTRAICLDIPCFRKEIRKTKRSSPAKSRILDQLYFSSDFYGILTEDEQKEWKIQ